MKADTSLEILWTLKERLFLFSRLVIPRIWLFVTPWTAARQAFLSLIISQSLPKFILIAWVMPPSHLILLHPLLLLPSVFPSVRDFANESAVHIRWPKYWILRFMDHCLWWRGLHNWMKLWDMSCRAIQNGRGIVESSDKVWSTGGGNDKPPQYTCCENFMNYIKGQKKKAKWIQWTTLCLQIWQPIWNGQIPWKIQLFIQEETVWVGLNLLQKLN